jgi:hypothetical protein
VYTNGTYSNPSWITGLAWSKISSTPTTLAGYGITDAASSAGTFYIGTTSIGINRASAFQTLTGVSIDGNAATVTNGVYTSGTYSNPSWITGLAWSKISSTPTTLAGYGITDSLSASTTYYIGTTSLALNRTSASQTLSGVSIDGNAGTVTNGVYTNGTYSNPSWITGLAWSKISSTPTTVSGYGITDALSTSWTGSTNITTLGTVTTLTSPSNIGSAGVRKITMSTSSPSGGADGDIWIMV